MAASPPFCCDVHLLRRALEPRPLCSWLGWHSQTPVTSSLPPPAQSGALQVRKQLQARYQELEVKKDGMKFLNKPMKAAAQRLQQLSGEYERRQAELLAQVRVGDR